MLKWFFEMRSKRCARAAIRAMTFGDYADAQYWLRKAGTWERLAQR